MSVVVEQTQGGVKAFFSTVLGYSFRYLLILLACFGVLFVIGLLFGILQLIVVRTMNVPASAFTDFNSFVELGYRLTLMVLMMPIGVFLLFMMLFLDIFQNIIPDIINWLGKTAVEFFQEVPGLNILFDTFVWQDFSIDDFSTDSWFSAYSTVIDSLLDLMLTGGLT